MCQVITVPLKKKRQPFIGSAFHFLCAYVGLFKASKAPLKRDGECDLGFMWDWILVHGF